MFGLIMFICLVPSLILMFVLMYPLNWQKKARIFGVNNREEFKTGKSAEFIDIVTKTHNRQALILLIVHIVISVLLLFVPGITIKMIVWTVFVYIALFSFMIPYVLGNSEMKKYKKNLGIVSDNVLFADLKNVGNIHALNKPLLITANIVGIVILLTAFLTDAGIIPFNFGMFEDVYLCTSLIGAVILTNLILFPVAFMVDNSRNLVISENSDINANYNRSRKKVFSDYLIAMTWCTDIIALLLMIVFLFLSSEFLMILVFGIYLLVMMGVTGLLVAKQRKVEEKYLPDKTTLVEDDDDNWILGMFYYNPSDKKLNVEKRVGVGWTINMAHPVGKIIGAVSALTIIASLILLIWIGMMSTTPIKIINNDEYVICHQLRDEYKIDKDDILNIEFGDLKDISAIRVAGTGMENLAKGRFKVNGVGTCKFFLNPQAGKYIKIVTSDEIYYISESTEELTESLYESLK